MECWEGRLLCIEKAGAAGCTGHCALSCPRRRMQRYAVSPSLTGSPQAAAGQIEEGECEDCVDRG
eukprot:1125721-Prymnesium_polylepis.1